LFDMEVNIDKTHVILCHVGGYAAGSAVTTALSLGCIQV
jgi:hypothetical protein